MFSFSKKISLVLLFLLFFAIHANAASSPGVNKYAWEASLKTIKFMPLSSADPFSGVIITDWYSITPNVRYKVDIYVLSGILNARSVQVSIFKQVKEKNNWIDVNLSKEIANNLEENILNQAKQLRAADYK